MVHATVNATLPTDKAGAVERYDDGTVRLTYLQLSRDTFVELLPVAADQPAGLLHIGIETDDVAGSVANLRERGMTVADPTAGVSRARVGRITDPDGVPVEIMQIGPDSLQRQAIEAWRSRAKLTLAAVAMPNTSKPLNAASIARSPSWIASSARSKSSSPMCASRGATMTSGGSPAMRLRVMRTCMMSRLDAMTSSSDGGCGPLPVGGQRRPRLVRNQPLSSVSLGVGVLRTTRPRPTMP